MKYRKSIKGKRNKDGKIDKVSYKANIRKVNKRKRCDKNHTNICFL